MEPLLAPHHDGRVGGLAAGAGKAPRSSSNLELQADPSAATEAGQGASSQFSGRADDSDKQALHWPVVVSPLWAVLALLAVWLHSLFTWTTLRQQSSGESDTLRATSWLPLGASSVPTIAFLCVLFCCRPRRNNNWRPSGVIEDASYRGCFPVHTVSDTLLWGLVVACSAYAAALAATMAMLFYHLTSHGEGGGVVGVASGNVGGVSGEWWEGTQGVLLAAQLSAVPLYCLHRLLRPAWPDDPMFTVVELEALELGMDIVDGASLFGVPLVATAASLPHWVVPAAGFIAVVWYAHSGLRLAALFAAHLSPRSRVWSWLGYASDELSRDHTYVPSGRAQSAARLRALLSWGAIPLDVAAAGLRGVLIWYHAASVQSPTTELLLKNLVAIWRHYKAIRLPRRSTFFSILDADWDDEDDDRRGCSLRCRLPPRFVALGNLLVCVVCMAGSQIVINIILTRLWSAWVWLIGIVDVIALLFPGALLVAVYTGSPIDGDDGANTGGELCSMLVYFLLPATTWPLLYYRAGELPPNDALCSQATLLHAMRLWGVVAVTFTNAVGAGVDYEDGGPGNTITCEEKLIDTALASEMTMDLLSAVSFFSLNVLLPQHGEPLDSSLGHTVLAFAVLEVLVVTAVALPRSGFHGGTYGKGNGESPHAATLGGLKGFRLLIEIGSAIVRVVLLFRFGGALTTVFLAKSLVSVVHSAAGVWRGMCVTSGRWPRKK